ncbi:hypothetical protein ABID22_001128 [Pontibacter aydingkolensis]
MFGTLRVIPQLNKKYFSRPKQPLLLSRYLLNQKNINNQNLKIYYYENRDPNFRFIIQFWCKR